MKTTTVQPGERIDHIADRVYGDPAKYELLVAANPELDVHEPQAGLVIEVPDA